MDGAEEGPSTPYLVDKNYCSLMDGKVYCGMSGDAVDAFVVEEKDKYDWTSFHEFQACGQVDGLLCEMLTSD